MTGKEKGDEMGQVIQIDEGRIKDPLGEMVRGTVEEALNAMLDAEADQLCGAGRYERRRLQHPPHPQMAEETFAPNYRRRIGRHITGFGAQKGFLTTDQLALQNLHVGKRRPLACYFWRVFGYVPIGDLAAGHEFHVVPLKQHVEDPGIMGITVGNSA
jgi:hypothetical protein